MRTDLRTSYGPSEHHEFLPGDDPHAVCGRIGTPGVMSSRVTDAFRPHTDERDPRTWRTVETISRGAWGISLPMSSPRRFLSKKEERTRALIVSSSTHFVLCGHAPYEKAFRNSISCDHRNCHVRDRQDSATNVLPAKSGFEKWDAAFFSLTFQKSTSRSGLLL